MTQDDPASLLLVDDEPANLMALEAVLEPLGQRLVTARSGGEALMRVLEEDFAVILLDVRMPDMSGIECASLIRSRGRAQHTPIIFLTAVETSPEMIFEGYSTGAVDYLLKPFVPGVLRAKVEVFVQLAQAQARLRREVRERQQAAAELAKLNMLLEQRNHDLARANGELDAFCAMVAHDLRAPVRHVEAYAQLLKNTAAGCLPAEANGYLIVINEASARMKHMIDDFLRFARFGAAELRWQPLDMNVMVGEVAAELSAGVEPHRVRWEIDTLPPAVGDAPLVRQVWMNLLSNALKYSREREPARIEIFAQQRDEDTRYTVADNGIGFANIEAGRLFEAFFRMHPASRYEGLGIGLTSVSRIVQRHGGRVEADGRPGHGARFSFTLPRVSAGGGAEAAARH